MLVYRGLCETWRDLMTSHICGGQGGSESVTSYLPECVFQLKKFLSVKKYELRSTGVAHTHTRRGRETARTNVTLTSWLMHRTRHRTPSARAATAEMRRDNADGQTGPDLVTRRSLRMRSFRRCRSSLAAAARLEVAPRSAPRKTRNHTPPFMQAPGAQATYCGASRDDPRL